MNIMNRLILMLSCLVAAIILNLTGCSDKEEFTEVYRYNNVGKLMEKIDGEGNKVEIKYNDIGSPIEVKYSEGSILCGYDENGNRIWMKDGTGTTEYYYDAFDRLVGVIWKHSPWRLIVYDYDPWDYMIYTALFDLDLLQQESKYKDWLDELRKDVDQSSQRWREREATFSQMLQSLRNETSDRSQRWLEHEVKYTHDILGNITSIGTRHGTVNFSYFREKGQIERRLPNGIITRFDYSPDGSLKSLRHESSRGQLIGEYRYDYDAAGNIIKVYEQTNRGLNTTEYTWDTRGYLKELRLPENKINKYEYDVMGNRTRLSDMGQVTTYEYDPFGRQIKAGDTYYIWDKNGNVIRQIEKEGGKTKLDYDGRGFPIHIENSKNIDFRWDGDGNLISSRVDGELIHYLPNPLFPQGCTLAEFDKGGKLKRSYLYGDGLLGESDVNDKMRFFLEDGFNSIRHITDMNGKIIGTRDYTPFGEPSLMKGEMAGNFRMMGERFFPEMKSYFIGGRLYEPRTGRYFSPDLTAGYMERFDSFNKYAHGCNGAGSFSQPRCNQTKKNYTTVANGTGVLADRRVQSISGWEFYKNRIYKYVDDWIVKNGPGPITLMVRGMQHRIDEGEEYANTHFKGHRMLVLPSYSGGEPKSWRGLTDFIRTFFDRASPFRNLDMAALWRYLESRDCPVIVSIHESGANHDLAKNVPGICIAAKTGQNIPLIVPTSGNIGEHSMRKLQEAGVHVSPSVTDPSDIVGKIERPWWEANPVSKAWSSIGVAFGGRLSWILGWGYGLNMHAQHYDELTEIILNEENKDKVPLGLTKEQLESLEREGQKVFRERGRRQDEFYDDDNRKRWFPPDDGGGGGGGGGLIGVRDPFGPIEKQLGGIELSSTADFIGEIGDITGAVFDPEKGYLVLVGDKDLSVPAVKPEDLAVALLSVYGNPSFDPQFSLDPADPNNPKGPWLKAVYIPEEFTKGTFFGNALFEADWLLKQYAFGVRFDEQGKMQKRMSTVPGFKSTADLSFEQKDKKYGKETWNRFWIVSDIMQLKESDNSIFFAEAKMKVKARKQVPDPSSPTGLRDVDSEDDPIAVEFVRLFSDFYDQLSMESPEFERVRQLAKAVAVAKWLKKENIPVDMNWLNKYANKRMDSVVNRVHTISVQWSRESQQPYSSMGQTGIQTTIHELHLFGGVDLKVMPIYTTDDGNARRLLDAVRSKLRETNTGPIFSIMSDGESKQAVVLPVTKPGQELWKNTPTVEIDGVVYQFTRGDGSKKITKSIDRNGNTTEYSYDGNQKLKTVRISNSGGSQITGQKNGNSSQWNVVNPRGNSFQYRYNHDGLLQDVSVNGTRWATYEADPQNRKFTVSYEDFLEKLSYDERGNITEYEIDKLHGTQSTSNDREKISYQYNNFGKLTKISQDRSDLFNIMYSEDGEKPLRVSTSQGEIFYKYADQGHLQEVRSSDGLSANWSYDGDNVKELRIRNREKEAEYRYDEHGITYSKDFLNGISRYGYTAGLLSSVALDQFSEATYGYDNEQRLREVRFPNGGWIEYRHDDGTKRGKEDGNSLHTVSIILHPTMKNVK